MEQINDWLPGALCDTQLEYLFRHDVIMGDRPGEFGESSFDLTLGHKAWLMPKGGLKPSHEGYHSQTSQLKEFFQPLEPDSSGHFVLRRDSTALFEIGQRLHVQNIRKFQFHGQATAKSSIGRMDVLVRLIVDGMDCYEGFRPEAVTSGNIFVEITPLSFPVIVKAGIPITQLRIFYGPMDDCEMQGEELHRATLIGSAQDGYLRVDLSNEVVGGKPACAFRTRGNQKVAPVPLWKINPKIKPHRYWELVKSKKLVGSQFLPIEKERFYILRSKEKLALHDNVAVYCLAIDESIGEMRIHYAGFVHPLFGRERTDNTKGTPLIFEVRGHDVPVVLRDGEKLAKLKYYRMSKPFKRGRSAAAIAPGGYNDQTLKLSNFFAAWN